MRLWRGKHRCGLSAQRPIANYSFIIFSEHFTKTYFKGHSVYLYHFLPFSYQSWHKLHDFLTPLKMLATDDTVLLCTNA